tara:strand:+ start:10890 stop:11705 length:816 start_codon:yes stop_codon:yes gene_type:complete
MVRGTRLPLLKWFLAIYLLAQSNAQRAAMALMCHLDISWRAAWLLKHKPMEAVFQREQALPLQGMVSVDDTHLGGERVGGKRRRGSENKFPFVAAVELHGGHARRVRFDRAANVSFQALRDLHKVALRSDRIVTSDGLIGFEVLNRDGMDHQFIQRPRGKAGTEIALYRRLDFVLCNLKTRVSGASAYRMALNVQSAAKRSSMSTPMSSSCARGSVSACECPLRSIRTYFRLPLSNHASSEVTWVVRFSVESAVDNQISASELTCSNDRVK